MARLKDRETALRLRKNGLSYSQIKQVLNVSKGTLSVWLREYPLSRQQINELRAWNEKRIEKFRETMQRKRRERLLRVYTLQKNELLPLTKKNIYIAGLFLYLGEGLKATTAEVSISNTNPEVIKFFIYWLTKICSIPKKSLRARLHLYSDMNPEREISYWINILGLSKEHFRKPYIKKNSKDRINYRGSFGHGTCNLIVGSVELFEKTMMGIKVINDYVGMRSSARLEQRTYNP